ncbi:hypothetical protein [Actinophytocola sp.]|uniref:hypothetical protein n=1 Tax=Actinophytocola sp. TaxID=1872138 RepID=UPI00389A0446
MRQDTNDTDLTALRSAVAEAVRALDTAIAERMDVENVLNQANDELAVAREAQDTAKTGIAEADRVLSLARDGLRTARDPLVSLDATPVDVDDIVAGWHELTTWARVALEERRTTLSRLAQEHAAAAEKVDVLRKKSVSPTRTPNGGVRQPTKRSPKSSRHCRN